MNLGLKLKVVVTETATKQNKQKKGMHLQKLYIVKMDY